MYTSIGSLGIIVASQSLHRHINLNGVVEYHRTLLRWANTHR